MAREENLLILKMLQDGTISAEQAAELLGALDASDARAVVTPPVAPVPPTPPTAPYPPIPPTPPTLGVPPPPPELPEQDGEAFARARARIAAARERVAGVQEKLTAAEERLEKAADSPNPWEQMADVLKDLPGARSVTDALRGIDPGRIAAGARRQARRMARAVRSSLGDLDLELHFNLSEQVQGEPTLSSPREATTTVASGETLRVRNTLGDTEAIGADVPEVRIAGVLKVWATDRTVAESLAEQISLVVEPGSDGPTVRVQHPDKIKRVSLDLKVFVPQSGVKVSLLSPQGDVSARALKGVVVLSTQSGDARASEIVGDVAAETASGDVSAEGVHGTLTVSTASGDIQVIRVAGPTFRASTQSGDVAVSDSDVAKVTVETVSGDASIKRVTGQTLRVRAVSGDIAAEETTFSEETHLDSVSGYIVHKPQSPLSSGTISLVTVSGDTAVKLPAGANASLELSTKSGEISAKFIGPEGAEKEVKGSGMLRFSETAGAAGEGGTKISLSTMSGDVTVTQTAAAAAEPTQDV